MHRGARLRGGDHRDIAQAAKANVASITYHFGSKDALIAEALAEGFRRWFAEFAGEVIRRAPLTARDSYRAPCMPSARVWAATAAWRARLSQRSHAHRTTSICEMSLPQATARVERVSLHFSGSARASRASCWQAF